MRGLALALVGLLAAASTTYADVVSDWNVIALNAAPAGQGYPNARMLAMMHAAIFEAVNSIERKYVPYVPEARVLAGASRDAAASSAAHAVLVALLPGQRAAFDADLEASLASVEDSRSKADGIAIGQRAASRILALKANDGHSRKVPFTLAAPGDGVWQLTPHFPQPLLTQWRLMTPLVLRSAAQFDPGGPTSLASEQWVKDYNEVKSLGGRTSKTRSADQTAAAIFWTIQTQVPWYAAARAAIAAHGLGVVDSARLFALMGMALHDAQITVVEQKYRYNFWRPYTAIRNRRGPGNPALESDSSWEPLINTPGMPEYPSSHCMLSGAAAEVLRSVLGSDEVDVSVMSPPLIGVTRSWSSFTQMNREVENARVWGGIHYRTSDEHGTQIGRRIGEWAVKNYLRPIESGR